MTLRNLELETACRIADAQAVVAERLGWLLACMSGAFAWVVLDLRGYLDGPWSWLVGIAFGVLMYRLAVQPYHAASERAWRQHEAARVAAPE